MGGAACAATARTPAPIAAVRPVPHPNPNCLPPARGPPAQVFPRAASHPPRLLQQLEALLVDRLRVNDRLASTALLLAKGRDPNMGANLSLDAHRRVGGGG